MIEITDYADKKLFQTLDSYAGLKISYGAPPIFYWYRKMIKETRMIENCHYLYPESNDRFY